MTLAIGLLVLGLPDTVVDHQLQLKQQQLPSSRLTTSLPIASAHGAQLKLFKLYSFVDAGQSKGNAGHVRLTPMMRTVMVMTMTRILLSL